jgi:hypothetical protein
LLGLRTPPGPDRNTDQEEYSPFFPTGKQDLPETQTRFTRSDRLSATLPESLKVLILPVLWMKRRCRPSTLAAGWVK